MNFDQAVKAYQVNPVKEELEKQVSALCGEMTLNENVADLGGMTLAYDLWNEKLQAEGLSGQQLRHQQRQFFVSYADVWKSYKTDAELISQKTIQITMMNIW